jgi:hypothetical protein
MPDEILCVNPQCPASHHCARYFENAMIAPGKWWTCRRWEPGEDGECEGYEAKEE